MIHSSLASAMKHAIGACLVLAVLVAPARAQFDTAVVLGSVRDNSGGVMPGVTVTLRNTETGITAFTHTDENGNYQFLNVRIGRYEVSAEQQGFSKSMTTDVGVAVNARQRVDLTHAGRDGLGRSRRDRWRAGAGDRFE